MKLGITGHQNLGDAKQISKIKKKLTTLLLEKNITMGYTCLADGADQIFAEILYKIKKPYCVVIPSKNYEKTFNKQALKKYNQLIQTSLETITLSFNQPEEEAFYEAGKYIVENSDVVLAIWDGKEAQGLGGTGDIVKYCFKKNKKVIHLNPLTLKVVIIDID